VKTQVQASGRTVTAIRCRILVGDIVLEAFDSVCMFVVVGWFEHWRSPPCRCRVALPLLVALMLPRRAPLVAVS
jgi:hypothetical protein